MKKYKIEKVLNHNIVIGKYLDKEYILTGKGIGFNRKKNMVVLESEISHSYIIQDPKSLSKYEKLVLETDEKILMATEEAIRYAEKELNIKFNEYIHISLLDHFNFSIYRQRNNILVGTIAMDDYILMYPKLYDIAKEMVNILNRRLNVKLPDYEIGSIILHLHASIHKHDISKTIIYKEVISFSVNFIKEKTGKNFEPRNINLVRLVTHLKFALSRSENKIVIKNPILDIIKEKYKDSYQIAKELGEKIQENYGFKLADPEIGYLAVHIYNVVNN